MPSTTAAVAPRLLLAAPLLLLSGAAPTPPLLPGSWTFTNTPVSASLDGRPLQDLPVSESTSETVCLSPDGATHPAAWLARDLIADCTLDRQDVAGGRVSITGHCAPRSPGYAPGRLTITGRYTATSYDLMFTTLSPDDNGTMGFDGRMVGKRTGACGGT